MKRGEEAVLVCANEEDTRSAGRELGRAAARGELILLFGALGSGKTVFVKGLAEGLGADPASVSSPTFALVHEYGPSRPVLVHADFYRLDEGPRGSLEDLGLEEALSNGSVVAIEWPREPFLGRPAWHVEIHELEGGTRRIRITPPQGASAPRD